MQRGLIYFWWPRPVYVRNVMEYGIFYVFPFDTKPSEMVKHLGTSYLDNYYWLYIPKNSCIPKEPTSKHYSELLQVMYCNYGRCTIVLSVDMYLSLKFISISQVLTCFKLSGLSTGIIHHI